MPGSGRIEIMELLEERVFSGLQYSGPQWAQHSVSWVGQAP